MLSRRKPYFPRHHWYMREKQSHMAVQRWRKHLEAMIASLWNSLQVLFKLTVQCVAYFFVTHTKLHVVAQASVIHVFYKSNPFTNLVQHAEKITSKYFKIKDSSGPSISFAFYAHTVKMVANGEEN